MKVYRRRRLAIAARILASAGLALGASGAISCYTAGANSTGATWVSREMLPLDNNAARYANLYDAIEHLRPEYLRVRENGPTPLEPVAYLNGIRLANVSVLRHVPVWSAVDVRWVRPNQTSILYGASHHLGGGIFVRTK